MPKTASEDLELISLRLPSTLLKRVRAEAEGNHIALAHEVRASVESRYLIGLPPPMVELLEADRKEMGLTRQSYFHSLLDSRYRALLVKEAQQGATRASSKRK
jgi:hypothetical protein